MVDADDLAYAQARKAKDEANIQSNRRDIILQDDFESGNLSKWTFAVKQAKVIKDPTGKRGGKVLHIPYHLPAEGPAHRDCNRMISAELKDLKLTHFFVRGSFYLASTPSPTGARKLLYIFSHPRGKDGQWDLIVSVSTDIKKQQTPQLTVLSNYWPWSDLRKPAWSVAPVPYDEWHSLEVEVDLNTPGKKDGALKVWLNGKLVHEKANISWRKNDRPLGTIGIGYQIDRHGDTKARHEDRYWDDIVISRKRIGTRSK